MSARRISGWLYVAAAATSMLAYRAIAGGSLSWEALHYWLDDRRLRYELIPFLALSLLLAATRIASTARAPLEVVTAVAWLAMATASSAWRPVFNTVERMGASSIDRLAALTALAAATLLALGVSSIAGSGQGGGWNRCGGVLQGLGCGVLGVYLGRLAYVLFLNTRVMPTGGLEAFAFELNLRTMAFSSSGLLLAFALVCAGVTEVRRRGRRAVVERGVAADGAR